MSPVPREEAAKISPEAVEASEDSERAVKSLASLESETDITQKEVADIKPSSEPVGDKAVEETAVQTVEILFHIFLHNRDDSLNYRLPNQNCRYKTIKAEIKRQRFLCKIFSYLSEV